MTKRSRRGVLLAAAGFVLAACGSDGGNGDGAATSMPTTSATTVSTSTSETGSADTGPTGTDEPALTSVPEKRWSEIVDDELAALQGAIAGGGSDVAEVFTRLFGQPAEFPWPDDAAVTAVRVAATQLDDSSASIDWRFTVATDEAAVDLESRVAGLFADPRWETGARVESTLDSGVFITFNYPATAAAAADGWGTLAITVGPETDFGSPTGRSEMEASVTRSLSSINHAGPTWFFDGWLAEMPLPEGAELALIDATTVGNGVWLSAEYTAGAEEYERLVRYYAEDHTSGALELDASTLPDDLAALDYFTAGFFPTLAGYTIFATVERDLAQPESDVIVRLSVRVEN